MTSKLSLREALSDLVVEGDGGKLLRRSLVTSEPIMVDALEFVLRQWSKLTDEADLDIDASAEDVARSLRQSVTD